MHAPQALVSLIAAALLLTGGCSDQDPEAVDSGATPESATGESAAAPARCGEGSGGEEIVLEPEPGVRLPAAVYGEGGGTVLVLLHQTNNDGRCGWDDFAQAATEQDVTSIAFDMCGWAKAECPEEWSERSGDQAAYVVDYARSELGAERVVLMGASMGGARTIFALADGVQVDDWVSLSPAPAWDGRETTREAPAITVPGLVVHDPGDGDAEYAAARAAAQAAGAEFVEGRGGHGYEMITRIQGGLTPLGEQVVERVLSGPAAG